MAELTCTELTGCGLATILPARGVTAAAVGAALGMAIAQGPRASHGGAATLLGTGPDQWLAFAPATATLAEALAPPLAGVAHVIDQSGGYVVYDLHGADAARLLQKCLPVDLGPAACPIDAVIVSMIGHIGVIVWRCAADRFRLMVFRSFATSFRHAVDAAVTSL